MAKMMDRTGRQLEIERERIEVSTALPQPDPNWIYTDHAGHDHAYGTKDAPYPTLVTRESEPYWCPDCHDEHTDTWLECPLCGEKVTPGTYIDTSPKYLPGMTTYRIDGQEVTQEEGESLLAELQAEYEAEARRKAAEKSRKAAEQAEQAMRAEGFTDEQILRVVNRMVHGSDSPQS